MFEKCTKCGRRIGLIQGLLWKIAGKPHSYQREDFWRGYAQGAALGLLFVAVVSLIFYMIP